MRHERGPNLGLRHARGDCVGFLDCDDIWLPPKLEMQLRLFATWPEAGMVCGPTKWWYSWTGKVEDLHRDELRELGMPENTLFHPPTLLERFLRGEVRTPATCSVLLRREVAQTVGGFEEAFREMYEDQAFFVKVFRHARRAGNARVLGLVPAASLQSLRDGGSSGTSPLVGCESCPAGILEVGPGHCPIRAPQYEPPDIARGMTRMMSLVRGLRDKTMAMASRLKNRQATRLAVDDRNLSFALYQELQFWDQQTRYFGVVQRGRANRRGHVPEPLPFKLAGLRR